MIRCRRVSSFSNVKTAGRFGSAFEADGADGFSSTHKLIDDSFIKGILSEGFEYHVWTVDDPETARRFKRLGAKSITTNVPGYMRQNLAD